MAVTLSHANNKQYRLSGIYLGVRVQVEILSRCPSRAKEKMKSLYVGIKDIECTLLSITKR